MDLTVYQQRAAVTAQYPDVGSNLIYPMIGLANEAGEVLGKLKKIMRDRGMTFPVRPSLTPEDMLAFTHELGDCLWYIATIAHELNIDLSAIAHINLDKLADRARRDAIKGSGDHR